MSGNLTLDAILDAKRQIDKFGPTAREIWFIDRPVECEVVMAQFATELNHTLKGIFSTSGVKVFRADAADVLKLPQERRLGARIFQMMPGIWVVMSDGTVKEYCP